MGPERAVLKLFEDKVSVVLRRSGRVRAGFKGIIEDAVDSHSREMRVILAFHS